MTHPVNAIDLVFKSGVFKTQHHRKENQPFTLMFWGMNAILMDIYIFGTNLAKTSLYSTLNFFSSFNIIACKRNGPFFVRGRNLVGSSDLRKGGCNAVIGHL